MKAQKTTKDNNPGINNKTTSEMVFIRNNYRGSGKLTNKIAFITGGDSGIGRAIALHFAREGANIAILYHPSENKDANITKELIEDEGRECFLIGGDLLDPSTPRRATQAVIKRFNKLDILVNNAGIQHPQEDFTKVKSKDWEETFKINVFGTFHMVQEALKHLKEGGCIIITASVVAYQGNGHLIDYSSSKGALISFTRSLSASLAQKNIRVNAVAPGPIWTPLVASTFPDQKKEDFGKNTPMQRGGQPWEVATAFVFLASEDSSYITGQVIHPNGGVIINA
ncbi:SDR family oxidoreductase [Arcicella aquatica]|uniref:SDR family oxidoreductase n=1 Tax=Arcicella aquatica TaxID=217141 RepID=A0ABU5QLY6_9BACT|nr:SDR family oxidoreductase [Arcicella aquatica]MEA5257930.1 SDR family oxidoreductase [Arcicella aquatica]